ncbi:MAG: hypothetical protein ACLVKO_02935 [Dysgonomonas sp.]
MKILLFSLSAIVLILSFCSCDKLDADKNYLYIPSQITERDSANVASTVNLGYDSMNRLTEIAETITRDTITYYVSQTSISYDDKGNPLQMNKTETVYSPENKQNDTFENTYSFSYATDNTVDIIHKRNEENETISIKLNGDGMIETYSEQNSAKNIGFTYTGKNISTKTENNAVETYTYDDKRGLFRDINTPQWFIIAFLDNYDLKISALFERNVSIQNNPVGIQRKDAEEKTSRNLYEYTYNAFHYPIHISEGPKTNPYKTVDIYYTKAK